MAREKKKKQKTSENVSFYKRITVEINILIGTVNSPSLNAMKKFKRRHLKNLKYHISINVPLGKRRKSIVIAKI